MDRCIDLLVEPSLNLGTPLGSVCEVAFEQETTSIETLLEGFSGWQSFIDEACAIARANEIREANAALVCYDLLVEAPLNHWDGIHFLGTFRVGL